MISNDVSHLRLDVVDTEPCYPAVSGMRVQNLDIVKLPKILLVAASPHIMGGHSVMAERLVADLSNDGFQVGFLPIDSFPRPLRFISKIKFLRTLVNTGFYLCFLLSRVWRYDIVHIFSASYWSFLITPVPAILVSKMYGKKVVLHYHSGEAEDHLRRSGRFVHWLLKLPDRIVVPSQYLVEVFSRFDFETVAIANNVDLYTFTFRERETVQPKIIVARALEPLYNVSCAIRAFEIVKKIYPAAELTILGSGSLRSELENEVLALGLNDVVFTGRVEHDDLPELFDLHDIFLNTSSIDNMPVSILEAFASGLPVVTTAAGGIPWMVAHGETGLIAPIDDHKRIAAEIMMLCETPSLAKELAIAAKREIQKYTWKTVGAQWESLYSGMANAQKRNAH